MNNFKIFKGFTNKLTSTQETIRQVNYEPMRRDRFLILFPEEYNIITEYLHGSSGLSVNFNEFGLTTWSDIEFKVRNVISSPTTQQTLVTLMNQLEGIEVRLQMLDPTGVVISEWNIFGHIRHIEFGELNYESNGVLESTITFSVYNCTIVF